MNRHAVRKSWMICLFLLSCRQTRELPQYLAQIPPLYRISSQPGNSLPNRAHIAVFGAVPRGLCSYSGQHPHRAFLRHSGESTMKKNMIYDKKRRILRLQIVFAFTHSGSYSPYSQPMWVASTSSTSISAPSLLSYSFTVPQPLPPFHRRLCRLLPSGAS